MATDSAVSRLYCKGVFTTIRVIAGRPMFWSKHWHRLKHDAQAIGIDMSGLSEEMTSRRLAAAITGLSSGRARVSIYDDRPSELWRGLESEPNTTAYIIIGENRSVQSPFRLTKSPYPVNSCSPLTGVKSCNYLEELMSKDEATLRGFHEALRLNERGHITGGCMSNIFWLKGDRLYTPTLSTGCLPGTTREYVLENLECEEVEAKICEIEEADAVFLTSAGLGIVEVAEFDGRTLAASGHPILRLWRDLETK